MADFSIMDVITSLEPISMWSGEGKVSETVIRFATTRWELREKWNHRLFEAIFIQNRLEHPIFECLAQKKDGEAIRLRLPFIKIQAIYKILESY